MTHRTSIRGDNVRMSATTLRSRLTAASSAVNVTGGLSLAVYMLVVYPVRGTDSILVEQWFGLGAVALFSIATTLTAYRRAGPWWARSSGAPRARRAGLHRNSSRATGSGAGGARRSCAPGGRGRARPVAA